MTELWRAKILGSEVEGPDSSSEIAVKSLPLHVSEVNAGEAIFLIGDPKGVIFRTDSGSIAISGVSPSGARELIEEIGSGTVFGLGFLDEHVHDAIALSDCIVSCWSKDSLPFLQSLDPAVRHRQEIETEREFNYRRTMLVASAPQLPHRRLAGFLCVASRLNASQGRDPCLIDDSVDCASVAAFLKMDMGTLSQALLELRKKGLLEHEPPRGVRIIDLDALQLLVSGEEPVNQSLVFSDGVHA